jgi:CII-binding regulator of phage lambda lysogenization HflD
MIRKRKLLTSKKNSYQEFKEFKRRKIATEIMQRNLNEANEAIESMTRRLNELTEQCEKIDRDENKRKIDDQFAESLTKLIDEAILILKTLQKEITE